MKTRGLQLPDGVHAHAGETDVAGQRSGPGWLSSLGGPHSTGEHRKRAELSGGTVSELPDGGPAVIQQRLEDVEPGLGGVVKVVVDVLRQKAFAELFGRVLVESGI
jgi:hypothetical protein